MEPLDVLRTWTVQDSPPGAAVAALAARVEALPVGWLEDALAARSVVAMYNARTATAVVPADEAAWFGAAQLPWDDAGLEALGGSALPGVASGLASHVDLAVAAVSSALDGRSLSRDELHEALRSALPEAMLPWCEGCRSHHARRGLLVLAGLHGRLCIVGRAGRQPLFARTDQVVGWSVPEDPGPELVRRYRSAYGASSRQSFQQWSGLGTAHARALWEAVPDVPAETPSLPSGFVLLSPGDPVLLGRDRSDLVPDAAMRKTLWSAIPNVGLVLDDGVPVGLWKSRKKGSALEVSVSGPVDADAVLAFAERLAPHRGARGVQLGPSF